MNGDPPDASADDLLTTADTLLASVVPGTRGLWPRTVAFLVRMALEQAVDGFWTRAQPGMAACTMRAQLVCLPGYVEPALAQRVAGTWSGLSRACHYHTYELAPTVAELRHWHDEVTAAARDLASRR